MLVEQLQVEIEALPNDEYARLRQWFAERDWERWDEQLEADAAAGKLDILVDEALREKRNDRLLTFST